jgi:hypothetical protein
LKVSRNRDRGTSSHPPSRAVEALGCATRYPSQASSTSVWRSLTVTTALEQSMAPGSSDKVVRYRDLPLSRPLRAGSAPSLRGQVPKATQRYQQATFGMVTSPRATILRKAFASLQPRSRIAFALSLLASAQTKTCRRRAAASSLVKQRNHDYYGRSGAANDIERLSRRVGHYETWCC